MGIHQCMTWKYLRRWPKFPGNQAGCSPWEEVAETSMYFDGCRSSEPELLWFILQQMFFLFSDLCPGDSNLENEGVAVHDYATYTYLIEVISFVMEPANWERALSGSCSSPLWALHLAPSYMNHSLFISLLLPWPFPSIFPLCLQDYLSSSLQQLKFNYPLLHDLMVFHLFYLRKFCSRIWF